MLLKLSKMIGNLLTFQIEVQTFRIKTLFGGHTDQISGTDGTLDISEIELKNIIE